MGKKIGDKERPEAFNKFRDDAFTKAKVNYDSSNLVHYEIYRRALRRFGLVNDLFVFTYPDTVFSYDLRTEDGIASLMTKIAEEYLEIKNDIAANPLSMRDTLWPLFKVDYNPKFESFANDQLAEIDMDLSQIDKIIETEGREEAESRAAAKETSLEGTVGNPISIAESIRYTIDIRYIQSFGYTIEGVAESIGKQDLFNFVQRNLEKDAPFKISEEEQEARELAALKERAAQSNTSPINEPAKPTEPAPTSPLNPEVGSTPETKTGVTSTSAVTGAQVQLPPEESLPPPEGGVTVNVEPAPVQSTILAPGISAINEEENKAAQEKTLPGSPAAGSPPASNINVESEKKSETISTKETVESQIQKVPTESTPAAGPAASSPSTSSEGAVQNVPGEKGGLSVINDIQVKASQAALSSGPYAELLKSAGVSLDSAQISKIISTGDLKSVTSVINEASAKTGETASSQTSQINQLETKSSETSSQSTLESTSTKQTIESGITESGGGITELGVTKDQMQMPSESILGAAASSGLGEAAGATMPSESGSAGATQMEGGAAGPPAQSESPPTEKPAGAGTGPPSAGGFGDMEARLARIEFLLSGPLEVKIIE